MVRRYSPTEVTFDESRQEFDPAMTDTTSAGIGQWVQYADYLSMQAALREALSQWERWNYSELDGPSGWLCDGGTHAKRITELRKQFLED